MPLIREGRFIADDWLRPDPAHGDIVGDVASDVAAAKLLVPLKMLMEHGEALSGGGKALGVELSNDVDPDTLAPWLERLALISVLFPKSSDGRGFSIATRLRRLGYKGELRATGHLIADQYALARSCGFDTVEISEELASRQPEAHWTQADRAISLAYQRGYTGRFQNILTSRWSSS
jgi:uncharacterized protein (DUF934 family)